MNVAYKVIVTILVFLSVSSGVAKTMLMPQEVEFFGSFGFTELVLIIFGVIQVVGGVLMIFAKTRIVGAITVAVTFIVSLIVLILAKSIGPAVMTLFAIIALGWIVKQSRNSEQ